MIIIGAGLAGLLAGNVFQRAAIFEAGPSSQVLHKAVLRFRSPAVGNAAGIDFRKVLVHKGIWVDGEFVKPSIQLANSYSKKVINRLADRSIWKQEPVERFIAPEDLVTQLAERCGNRIEWNTPVTRELLFDHEQSISTMPMPLLAAMLYDEPGQNFTMPEFNYAPIAVKRWRVKGADVFQTIYYPESIMPVYRASITGDLLVAEFMGQPNTSCEDEIFGSFGIDESDVDLVDNTKQKFGKIAPIDEHWRKQFILNSSTQHGVYSVGRFATWRNILLDDVLQDLAVVKRLASGGNYEAVLNG
jgi:hypothetical protein